MPHTTSVRMEKKNRNYPCCAFFFFQHVSLHQNSRFCLNSGFCFLLLIFPKVLGIIWGPTSKHISLLLSSPMGQFSNNPIDAPWGFCNRSLDIQSHLLHEQSAISYLISKAKSKNSPDQVPGPTCPKGHSSTSFGILKSASNRVNFRWPQKI